jgi:uncharacterized protein YgfB (UPF0149 family)
MARTETVETPADRKALVREAGWRTLSATSLVAGVLCAYGAFALVAGITAAVLNGIGIDADGLSDADWRQVGLGAGIAAVVVLFVAYWFGGYVAGRMARRAGSTHGFTVFVLGVVTLAAAGVIVGAGDSGDAIRDNLRDLGVPTTAGEWAEIGTGIGIASLLAMLVGSILGGRQGERWHGHLLARAMDPDVGPEAEARERLMAQQTESRRVRDGAPVVDLTRPEAETRAEEMPARTEWVSTGDGGPEVPVRRHEPAR